MNSSLKPVGLFALVLCAWAGPEPVAPVPNACTPRFAAGSLIHNPHAIEFSEAQIQKYARHYHNTARPLQPLNGRPVVESQ